VRALLVYGHKPIVAAGKGSFGDALLVLAGGENVAGGSMVPYPTLPVEEIIRLAPEVIIDASASGSGAELGPDEVQEVWGKWEVLPAVKHHRTHIFNSSEWFRAGPRIGEGLLKLAKILHPNP
jgi:iron complex transport system substrate-binding protein